MSAVPVVVLRGPGKDVKPDRVLIFKKVKWGKAETLLSAAGRQTVNKSVLTVPQAGSALLFCCLSCYLLGAVPR